MKSWYRCTLAHRNYDLFFSIILIETKISFGWEREDKNEISWTRTPTHPKPQTQQQYRFKPKLDPYIPLTFIREIKPQDHCIPFAFLKPDHKKPPNTVRKCLFYNLKFKVNQFLFLENKMFSFFFLVQLFIY